jgi:hypothetical protein
VKQGPQLHHIILQRRSSQQKPSLTGKLQQHLPTLGAEILDMLGLVKDQIVPLLATEYELVLNDKLIACDSDMELIGL